MERSVERRQFLHDVFVTALEGGIGYWSAAYAYEWDIDGVPDLDGFHAEIVDEEDDKHYRIDIDTIAHGVSLITKAKTFYDPNGPDMGVHKGDVEYLTKGVADIVRKASSSNDAGNIDASVADEIVQVGLFGKVVYG